MKRRFLIFLSIGIVLPLYAADFSDSLWVPFLPAKLRTSPYARVETQKLKTYARLNPQLIYLYLEVLHRKFDLKIENPDSNFQAYFAFVWNTSRQKKSEWANRMILEIDRKETLFPLVVIKLRSFFKEAASLEYSMQMTDSVPPPPDFDANRSAYFEYVYFSGKQEGYQPQIDYREKVREELHKLARYFDRYYPKLSLLNKKQSAFLLKKAKHYSYIFADSYLPRYAQTRYTLLDFVYKALLVHYTNHPEVHVEMSYSPYTLDYDRLIRFEDLFGLRYSAKVRTRNNLFGWLGGRIVLRKFVLPFSVVNFKAGIGLTGKALDVDDRAVGHIIRYDGDLYVNGTYYIGKIRDIKMKAYAAQISVPFFYLSNKFYLEGGLFYAYYDIKLTYDYWFDGYVIAHANNGIPDFYKGWTRTVSARKHRLKALLAVHYTLFDFLALQANFLIYNDMYGGISLFYRF